MIGVLHTARINAIEFIVSSDKWTLLSKSSRNSVNRALVMLINSPSHFITELKRHHLY